MLAEIKQLAAEIILFFLGRQHITARNTVKPLQQKLSVSLLLS